MNDAPANEGLRAWAHLIYALHGFSVLVGIMTPMFVVTAFLLGWPSIIGVILNYIKRGEAKGTYLESHFRWQIRTFWYAALWCCLGGALWITIVGFLFAIAVWVATGIWVAYRVIRGWLALVESKPLPV